LRPCPNRPRPRAPWPTVEWKIASGWASCWRLRCSGAEPSVARKWRPGQEFRPPLEPPMSYKDRDNQPASRPAEAVERRMKLPAVVDEGEPSLLSALPGRRPWPPPAQPAPKRGPMCRQARVPAGASLPGLLPPLRRRPVAVRPVEQPLPAVSAPLRRRSSGHCGRRQRTGIAVQDLWRGPSELLD
jgi:hypothetical protein